MSEENGDSQASGGSHGQGSTGSQVTKSSSIGSEATASTLVH